MDVKREAPNKVVLTVTANMIQKRRLLKQLTKAGYSRDAIREILRLYGAEPK